ncbi:MAG: response regulator [Spirochaetales bacterium]|nr:response regulator [Spirochaetales bacterium]
MEFFLLSYHSLLNLLNSVLSLAFSIALFSKKDGQPATRWLGAMYAGYFLLFFGYFLSFSVFHPLAAYHRIITTAIIFGLLAFVGFVYRYPENDERRVPRRWIWLAGAGAVLAWLHFAHSLTALAPVFRFESHIFTFDAGRLIAIVILSLMIWSLVVIVNKWRRYSRLARTDPSPQITNFHRGTRGFALALALMVFVGLLNFLVNWKLMSFELYSFMFSNVTSIAFFYVFMIYITYSPEPTTFLVKIVSISGMSVILLFGLVSNVALRQAEAAYDRTRSVEMDLAEQALSRGRTELLPASLAYVLQSTPQGLKVLKGDPGEQPQLQGLELLELLPGPRAYRQVGESYFTVYTREQATGSLEFGFAYIDYRREMHAIAVQFALLILVALALLLVLLPLFFRPGLIRPLRQLMAGVERIQAGDLSQEVPVQVEDEIGYLTRSFNRMQKTIGEARENLEQKVAARTQELEKAMQKLQEMDELKTNFFANISHELRTPLTLLLSPMESFLQKEFGELQPEQSGQIAAMHRNAQKLLNLINNLLDFSKLEAGRMEARFQQVDLVAYVRELVSAFDSAARSAGLELSVEGAGAIRAAIDPEKMEKILLNLLSNAFKFTERGEIIVRLNQDGGSIQISVEDSGAGIPPDKLETIFERFSQVDGSASRRYEGTGIGLALARELAHLHGGDLRARSAGPGQGSRFILTFPAEQATAEDAPDFSELRRSSAGAAILADLRDRSEADPATDGDIQVESDDLPLPSLPHAPVAVKGQRATVLIVEDTHDMRKFLVFLLRPHFELITARNGKEGFEKARRHRPDLIVSDVMMPEWSGYQLLAAIRERKDCAPRR